MLRDRTKRYMSKIGGPQKIDKRLTKWISWLDVIKAEIQDLVIAKHTFHEVQKMIVENSRLQNPNLFYRYFTSAYVSHVVIGLRRQIKTDPESISLVLLLQELEKTPELLNRKYYVSLYEGSAVEFLANGDFEKFAVPNGDHIDPAIVKADLQKLRDTIRCCEEFADKRIAHRDKRDPKILPTYNEVDACIDLLDELYVQYLLRFQAKKMNSLLPTLQYDWKEIFRIPWIPSKD